jgi:hypothetical protein
MPTFTYARIGVNPKLHWTYLALCLHDDASPLVAARHMPAELNIFFRYRRRKGPTVGNYLKACCGSSGVENGRLVALNHRVAQSQVRIVSTPVGCQGPDLMALSQISSPR